MILYSLLFTLIGYVGLVNAVATYSATDSQQLYVTNSVKTLDKLINSIPSKGTILFTNTYTENSTVAQTK